MAQSKTARRQDRRITTLMVSLVDWNTGVSLQLSRNSVPSKSIFLTIGDNPGRLHIMVRCVWGRTPAEFHIATASVTLPPRRTLYVDILCCSRRSLSWVMWISAAGGQQLNHKWVSSASCHHSQIGIPRPIYSGSTPISNRPSLPRFPLFASTAPTFFF